MIQRHMLIDGRWVSADSGATRSIINPHDASELARVAEGDRADAQAAIQAARRAFDHGEWPRRSASDRAAVLTRLAAAVREHATELARLETLDTGKTLTESAWDMSDVADIFDYYAELGGRDDTEALASPNPDSSSRVVREPVGVCALICPWNYPLLQASWKLAPALVAGCTMVLKPSELTPLTSVRFCELAQEAGVPAGVLNLVLGAGATVGAELAENAAVDLVSFTGGVTTGQTIMRAASSNLKRIALELGGKNPHIIFDDADLDVAVDHALNAVFFHAGQICSAGARLLLQEGIADAFTARLQARMARIQLGNGMDDATQMGPLISAEHRAGVARRVAAAQAEGARLLLGGDAPSDEALARGFYYLPTLFTDCTSQMAVVREEIFGPVITIERFDTEEEALRRANDTDYGLSAGFRTEDPARIERMSRGLRFGTVWVNDYNVYFAQAPWGGFKRSGIGRELGTAGLDEYREIKHIYESHAAKALNWFGVLIPAGRRIEAVLFDMDGTLILSEDRTEAAVRDLLAERAIEVPSAFDLSQFHGVTWTVIAHTLVARWPALKGMDVAKALQRSFHQSFIADPPTAVPGAREAVVAAAAAFPVAIVTSSNRETVALVCEQLQLTELITATVSADDCVQSKPSPEPFEMAAVRLGIAPEHCLVFEDSPAGVHAGTTAGATVIAMGAESGHRPRIADFNALPKNFFSRHAAD